MDFDDWFDEDDFDLINFPEEAMKVAYQAGQQDQREKDARLVEELGKENDWNFEYDAANDIAKAIRSQDD